VTFKVVVEGEMLTIKEKTLSVPKVLFFSREPTPLTSNPRARTWSRTTSARIYIYIYIYVYICIIQKIPKPDQNDKGAIVLRFMPMDTPTEETILVKLQASILKKTKIFPFFCRIYKPFI
jgi:hypothetical protein